MKLPINDPTSNSTIQEVNTPVGTFRIYFPHGVYNAEDRLNDIPRALESFHFYLPEDKADSNAVRLQNKLNEVVKFGTDYPSYFVDLCYQSRTISLR